MRCFSCSIFPLMLICSMVRVLSLCCVALLCVCMCGVVVDVFVDSRLVCALCLDDGVVCACPCGDWVSIVFGIVFSMWWLS